MLMCNLIECSNDYAKTSVSLWQYLKDDPNDDINSESFKYKSRFTNNTNNAVKIAVTAAMKIAVPLKYLKFVSATSLLVCVVSLKQSTS